MMAVIMAVPYVEADTGEGPEIGGPTIGEYRLITTPKTFGDYPHLSFNIDAASGEAGNVYQMHRLESSGGDLIFPGNLRPYFVDGDFLVCRNNEGDSTHVYVVPVRKNAEILTQADWDASDPLVLDDTLMPFFPEPNDPNSQSLSHISALVKIKSGQFLYVPQRTTWPNTSVDEGPTTSTNVYVGSFTNPVDGVVEVAAAIDLVALGVSGYFQWSVIAFPALNPITEKCGLSVNYVEILAENPINSSIVVEIDLNNFDVELVSTYNPGTNIDPPITTPMKAMLPDDGNTFVPYPDWPPVLTGVGSGDTAERAYQSFNGYCLAGVDGHYLPGDVFVYPTYGITTYTTRTVPSQNIVYGDWSAIDYFDFETSITTRLLALGIDISEETPPAWDEITLLSYVD